MQNYKKIVEEIWEKSNFFDLDTKILDDILSMLENGQIRAAEKINHSWQINDWVKKAILIKLKQANSEIIRVGENINAFDKILPRFRNIQTTQEFQKLETRIVPGGYVREGAYIGKQTVIMPSFINIGAYIGDGTMIDSWATIGSCAQVGKNCHISGGVGIGGVLEPLQAMPVIIEDNSFIGARSEIAEGVIVREGAVISMGVYIGASTKIIYRDTGKIIFGEVPPYSVVIPGNIQDPKQPNLSTYAAIIIKTVDEKTRAKTSINELLR